MRDKLTEQVEVLIMPFIEELSAELIELHIKHKGKTAVIEIIADRPGGITIGECTFINKKADQKIEEKQLFGQDYIVEVSSPGLDRALKTSKDFARVIGRKIRVHLTEKVEEKLEYHGNVIEANDDNILIKTKDKTITIPFAVISKAAQVIE